MIRRPILREGRIRLLFSDPVIALILFVLAAVVGGRFIASGHISPRFHQSEFMPAVMEACGHGFMNMASPPSALIDFLQLKADSFSCSAIPQQFVSRPVNGFQAGHRYLMWTITKLWQWNGVSWHAVLPLGAAMFGFSGALVYGLFRLAMGQPLAVVFALAFISSGLQRENLPHLRDYGKAPFILAVVLILGWLLKLPRTRAQGIGAALLLGLVLAVGMGFRLDLMIFIPVGCIGLLVFSGGDRHISIWDRLLAIGLFLAVLWIVAVPLFSAVQEGSNFFHVILLGLTSYFDPGLDIQAADIYELGWFYNDVHLKNLISVYAHQKDGIKDILSLYSPLYDAESRAYYLDIVKTFPADIVTRVMATMVQVLKMAGRGFFFIPAGWSAPLSLAGVWIVLAALAGLAAHSFRLALFAVLAVVYLAGYPSLQYHIRHSFHLQFVPLMFIGLALDVLGRRGIALVRGQIGAGDLLPGRRLVGGVVLFALIAAIPVLALAGLRSYQQERVTALIDTYLALPTDERRFEIRAQEQADVIRLWHPAMERRDSFPIISDYWRLDLDGRKCGVDVLKIHLNQDAKDPFYDSSLDVDLDIRQPVHYFFASYSLAGEGRFVGVDMNAMHGGCVTGFAPVRPDAKFGLPLTLAVPDKRDGLHLYQTIGRSADLNGPMRLAPRIGLTTLMSPKTLGLTQDRVQQYLAAAEPLQPSMVYGPLNQVADGILFGHGIPANRYDYVAQYPGNAQDGPYYFVAEGEVVRGGLTIGLIHDQAWAGQVNISSPGRFRVLLAAGKGIHLPTIAYDLWPKEEAEYRITRAGWVAAGRLDEVKSVVVGATLSASEADALAAKAPVPSDRITIQDPLARLVGGVLKVGGTAANRYTYILQMPPETVSGRQYLVAEGFLYEGGLTLGLIKNQAWAGQANLTTPGRFRIVVAEQPGVNVATLAHNLPAGLRTNIRIDRLGWVSPD